jgi:hypothetical protein
MRRRDRTAGGLADSHVIKKLNWLTRSSDDRRKDWHELFACRTSSWEAPGFSLHPLRVHSCTAPFSDVCSLAQP